MKCCLLSNTNPILISFITFTLFSDLALASFSYQQDCTRPLTPDTPLLAISSALPTHKDFINTINAKLEVMGETVHDKSFDSFTIMAQQLGELNQVLQNPAYQHLPGATKLYGHILAPLIHQIKPLQEFAKVVQDYYDMEYERRLLGDDKIIAEMSTTQLVKKYDQFFTHLDQTMENLEKFQEEFLAHTRDNKVSGKLLYFAVKSNGVVKKLLPKIDHKVRQVINYTASWQRQLRAHRQELQEQRNYFAALKSSQGQTKTKNGGALTGENSNP